MRLPLLMAAFLVCSRLTAQEIKYQDDMGWRGNRIELHTISDRAKQQACLFLANDDSIKAYLLNDKAEVVQQHYFIRKPGEELLGGFMKQGKLYFFITNIKTDELHNRVFDMKTGEVTEHQVPFDLKKEKIIERISCGDHFLYLTINKKTSEISVYDFYSESQFNTFSNKFEDAIWESITRDVGFNRSINVQKIDQEGECGADIASWKNKVYFDNDTVYLVVNSKRRTSRIYAFDLINKKVSNRELQHNVVKDIPDPLGYSDNSFLLDKKLYYVHCTDDNITVQIFDILSGQLLKRYDAKAADEIEFKNTPILQDGSTWAKNTVRELGKTRQLLRKMAVASAVIIPVRNENNQVEISIGSFLMGSSGGMVLMGGMLGGAMGGALVGVMMPAGGFSRSGAWAKSARFRMRIDANTYEFVPGHLAPGINERIEEHTKNIKIPPEAENLFVIDHKYYHAYYDRKERKLMVVKY